nr:PP2C family protein-serine/threonine phosphatase [Leptospiraceae bacterium]
SCGHSKPALYKAESGKVELLGSGGMPLGAIDNDIFETALEVCTVNLKKGDIFFQYTDGLNEAMNSAGELYGTDRMENIIRNASKDNVEELTLSLARDAEAFSGKKIFCEGPSELNDDIAIIAFKRI